MSKVTIKDVAREAGVSISTVSNALNDVDVLRPETKQHILEVAERLHYIPDSNGRSLKSGKTSIIGLYVPCVAPPYYGTVAESIFWECQRNGYELNITISHQSSSMMRSILGKRVDGAIILNNRIEEDDVEALIDAKIPVVFLDREASHDRIGSVLFDSYHDGAMAARYFLDKGFKKLGYIMGIMKSYDDQCRYQGYRDTIEAAGLKIEEDYIWMGNFEIETSRKTMERFLQSGVPLPDAIFAANDLSAIGCMDALKKAGIRIPEDISIIGCDDIQQAEWYQPALTTIRTEFEEQGRNAVRKLLRLIRQEEKGSVTKMKGKIVERQSVR